MQYPVQLTRVGNLELFLPVQVKETFETRKREQADTPFPFWAKIWTSGYELARFLLEEPHYIQSKNVLELGAGIAFPSFSIAPLASMVIVSDHNQDAVALMEKNIRHLQLTQVQARLIDWNDALPDMKTDVLLLSDINYDGGQFAPLLSLIEKFISQNTTIMISTPQRINIAPFAEALRPFIKRSELRTPHHDVDTRIWVLAP